MNAEGFFRRWSRLKSEDRAQAAPAEQQGAAPELPAAGDVGAAQPLPTIDDVAHLTADSDYSAFLRQGVDKTVQRLALKKLFSDPHFNLMDGLDIYIADYNQASPLPAAMLASLRHARHFLEQAAQDEDAAAPDGGDDMPADQPMQRDTPSPREGSS